ncbi:MAG: hypothetical protein V2J62_12305 [candidate division KSB1 bacterium]|jgi:hypothetical protein|nr:hypothetical protein [candidate division KSB1 bacterium]
MKIRRLASSPLTILFICAVVIYCIVLWHIYQNSEIAITGDAAEYIRSAHNLIDHHVIYCGDLSEPVNPDLFSRRLFMYPALIAFVIYLFNNYYLVIGLQMMLVFINVFLILTLLKEMNVSEKWSRICAAIYLIYPSQIIFTGIIMTEILLQSFLLSAFFFYSRFFRERTLMNLFLYNLMLMGAVATKPVMLYIWLPNIVVHLWAYAKERKRLILVFPAMLLILISAWSYRNERMTGVYHFSSIRNHNLLNYNIRSLLTVKYGQVEADRVIDDIEMHAEQRNTYPEKYDYLESRIKDILKEYPLEYAAHHMKGLLNFFLDPGRFELCAFFNCVESVSFSTLYNRYGYGAVFRYLMRAPVHMLIIILATAIINLALFVSFFYFIVARRRIEFECWAWLMMICAYIALITGPIGASRFRLPIFPFLVIIFALTRLRVSGIKSVGPLIY